MDSETVKAKPILKSKTFWVNIGLGAIGYIWGQVAGNLDPGIAATVTGVVNIIMRLITKSPVTITGEK